MTRPLQPRDIPNVLPDDEDPFVIRWVSDRRRFIEFESVRYRRSDSRIVLDLPLSDEALGLRGSITWSDDATYLAVNGGPMLHEWWPVVASAPPSPERPFLSAGARGTPVVMELGEHQIPVRVIPSNDTVTSTLTAVGLHAGGTTPTTLSVAGTLLPAVAKAALATLQEYRTLVPTVPDIDVESSGHTAPLRQLLDAAAEIADSIGWNVAGTTS